MNADRQGDQQRIVELQQKLETGGLAATVGEAVGAEGRQPPLGFRGVEPLGGIAAQASDHLGHRQSMGWRGQQHHHSSEQDSRSTLPQPGGFSRAPGRGARIATTLSNLLQLSQQSVTHMTDSASRFGFVAFAETWNGRLAMLGFVIGLGTELLTGQGILSQIGLG